MHINTFRNFLQHEKRFSDHTVQAYIADVEQFCLYLAEVYDIQDPSEIDAVHIRSWMVYLMDGGTAARSINRKLSSLRSWYRVMRRRGVVDSNPFARINGPKSGKRLPDVIDNNRLRSLFEQTEFPETYSGARDRMILDMLYGCGMRRSELIGLKVSDVNFSRGVIRVEGKGRKQREIPLLGYLARSLREYLALRGGEIEGEDPGYLFLTDKGKQLYPKMVYNIVKRHLSIVTQGNGRSPHALRHAFATHLAENGADINAIKELLGHSSLAATQVYMHTSISRLKAAYDQAHPNA